jgi:hypothetical protein
VQEPVPVAGGDIPEGDPAEKGDQRTRRQYSEELFSDPPLSQKLSACEPWLHGFAGFSCNLE